MRYKDIMEKLVLLDPDARICYRGGTSARSSDNWCVEMPRIMGGSVSHNRLRCLTAAFTGETPVGAICNAWRTISINYSGGSRILVRCNRMIAGKGPGSTDQAWVQWNDKEKNWVDVKPTKKAANIHSISPTSVIPFRNFLYRDKMAQALQS